jgi:cation diffusion facilitator family transporter
MNVDQLPGAGNNSQEEINKHRYKETFKVTLVGAITDLILGVSKITVGLASHSQALVADGLHSLSDLATDALVIYATKHATRVADEEHPYGHARIETAATVVLGVTLIAVAGGICYDAVIRLFEPDLLLKPGWLALTIASLSIISKEIIYHYTMSVAKKLRSDLLKANAWHSRTDAISSILVVIGILGTMAGLTYLDAIAAIAVAVIIAKIGWDLGWRSLRQLVDTSLEKEQVAEIRKSIVAADGVDSLHMLRTRSMGGDALVDVHVQVSPILSVSEGHHIGESVRKKLIAEFPHVSDVMVHIDTENDQAAAASLDLPDRNFIIDYLNKSFSGLELAANIRRTTLHYINGQLHAEIILPLALLEENDADSIRQQFQGKLENDKYISLLTVLFC